MELIGFHSFVNPNVLSAIDHQRLDLDIHTLCVVKEMIVASQQTDTAASVAAHVFPPVGASHHDIRSHMYRCNFDFISLPSSVLSPMDADKLFKLNDKVFKVILCCLRLVFYRINITLTDIDRWVF